MAKDKENEYKRWVLPLLISAIGLLFMIYTYFSDRSQVKTEGSTKAQIAQTLLDTIQNREIVQLKECSKATSYRLDRDNDKITELQEMKQDLRDVKQVLLLFVNRFDKTLLPLLQERQSMIKMERQQDSAYFKNYSYSDSSTVILPTNKEDSLNTFRSLYNLAFKNSYVNPFFQINSNN